MATAARRAQPLRTARFDVLVLPQTAAFYHGDRYNRLWALYPQRGVAAVEGAPDVMWFTFDPEQAARYSDMPDPVIHVGEYIATQPLRLFRADSLDNWRRLLASPEPTAKERAAARAFVEIQEGTGEPLRLNRFSIVDSDVVVLQLLCRLGFDGYYASRLPSRFLGGSWFAEELAVCDPADRVQLENVMDFYNFYGTRRGERPDVQVYPAPREPLPRPSDGVPEED